MLNRSGKIQVGIDYEPPRKWPLWFHDQHTYDDPDKAPISPRLRDRFWQVTSFIASQTQWCEVESKYFFTSKIGFEEFNRIAYSASTDLIMELGESFKVYPMFAILDTTGHVVLVSNAINFAPRTSWINHACN
jgi:hypothetical protein